MLTDQDEAGDYKIPFIIYSDAYSSETVPTPTWSCRTRPISSAGTASPCSTGRSAMPTGRATRSASRWSQPDRDVRPFQTVLIDLGARLGLPGFVNEDGAPKYRDYADYIVNHERTPGIGPLAGWRGADGDVDRQGRAEPGPAASATSTMAASGTTTSPPEQRYYKMANRAYLDFAVADGLHRRRPSRSSSSSIPSRCRNSAWPRAAMARCSRRRRERAAHRDLLRSAAVLVRAVRGSGRRPANNFRCTRSRSGRCTCTIPGARRMPGCGRSPARTGCSCITAPRAQPRPRRRRLGLDREHQRPREGADPADRRRQSATRSGPGTRSASGAAAGA